MFQFLPSKELIPTTAMNLPHDTDPWELSSFRKITGKVSFFEQKVPFVFLLFAYSVWYCCFCCGSEEWWRWNVILQYLEVFISPGIGVQMQRLRGRECGVFPVPCLDSTGGISVNMEVKHASLEHIMPFYSIVRTKPLYWKKIKFFWNRNYLNFKVW